MDTAYGSKEQCHSVLSYRIRRISRNTYNMNLAVSILNIDIVIAGAAKRNEPDAHLIKLIYDK